MKQDANFKATLSEELYLIRGIAIVLVVIGHVIGYNREYGMRQMYNSDLSALGLLCDFINTFHMPVFFIASGVAFAVFSNKDTSYMKFARSKFEKLLIPLICWAPPYFIFQNLVKGKHFSFLDVVNSVIYPYEIFWFIHALIFATFFSFICFKLFKAKLVYFSLSVLLFVLGYGYWNIFYAFGVFIASYLPKIRLRLEKVPLTLVFIAGLCCISAIIFNKYFVANNIDNSRIFNGPAAFLFMYAMVVSQERIHLPKLFGKIQNSIVTNFAYLGVVSMIIYLFHGYFTRSTIIFIVKIFGLPEPLFYFIVVSIMGVLGPTILYKVLQPRSKMFVYSIGGAKS